MNRTLLFLILGLTAVSVVATVVIATRLSQVKAEVDAYSDGPVLQLARELL